MAESIRPKFDLLDSEGLKYHRCVSDVETTFVGKDYTSTIKPSIDGVEPSEKLKANSLMFLRRHIDPSLRWEYLQLKTPKELWDALKGRFRNIHNTLLPELNVQWNEIHLLDYKRVNDFNKDMLRLKARLKLCEKEISKYEMIQKILSTFPTSAMILANQYRLEYDNKRITTFSKLINLLQVVEIHNEVLLNNNVRPVGTKKIPEANYGKFYGGKNPKEKGAGRVDPYSRGNHGTRGRGHGRGRGGHFNTWRKDGGSSSNVQGTKVHKTYKNPPTKKERVGNEPCYRCGDTNHCISNAMQVMQLQLVTRNIGILKNKKLTIWRKKDMNQMSTSQLQTLVATRIFAQSIDVPDFD